MRGRIASSVIVAAAVIVGTAGCDLIAPQATTYHYFASDGVSADLGDVAVRNAVVVTDKGKLGNLVVTIVNSGSSDAEITVQHEGVERQEGQSPSTLRRTRRRCSDPPTASRCCCATSTPSPARSCPSTSSTATSPGKELLVPVLDGGLPEYADLLPIDVVNGQARRRRRPVAPDRQNDERPASSRTGRSSSAAG